MKLYLVTYKFYYDNELLSERCSTHLQDIPDEEECSGTDFDGLWDMIYKWAALVPFVGYEFKKGKRLIQHYDWLFKRITPDNCKPWKFVITSKEISISMERLMRYDTE